MPHVLVRLRLLVFVPLVLAACDTARDMSPSTSPAPTGAPEPPWFQDRAAESGLALRHQNGMSGKFHYAEVIAPGTALFDYDNDRDLDAYLVTGGALDTPPASQLHGRLFRNDLSVAPDGARSLRFTDVTEASRVGVRGVYGMGVAAGDVDNNGCVDLYMTSLGPNALMRNNCDGTFTRADVPGVPKGPSWTVSAAFLDYDRDGWLDLFETNYLSWRAKTSAPCPTPSGRPDYCSPNTFQPLPSRLLHNNGNGTFTDVSAAAGIAYEFGPALGVSTADVNGDGWPDVYVANDGQPNLLWMNQRDGTFKNLGLLSGTALSANAKPKAGMGVDAGDVDNDGDEDLFVTNLSGEGNDLYVNDGQGYFEEHSGRSGLGPPSRGFTGFGTGWFDIDNDGWLDTITVNGAVQTIEALRRANDPFPLHQRKRLFRSLGNGRFEDVSSRGGPAFELSEVGRGAAFGDVDNDGDVDVLVANNDGPVRLLVNAMGSRSHWVGARLVGGARDMLGARVAVQRADGVTVWRRARSDGSYASASDSRVVVGLGQTGRVTGVRVTWPSGRVEHWPSIEIDQYTTLREGQGSSAR